MQRCAELYKKLRNTFRFLLGNLNGFDPARDQVAEAEPAARPLHAGPHARPRRENSRLVRSLRVSSRLSGGQRVRRNRRPESSFISTSSKTACTPFCADEAKARRSAQTVLWKITEALVRLVAPILTFTADEIWEYLPAVEGRPISVHLALFPKPEEIFSEDPAPEELLPRNGNSSLPVRDIVHFVQARSIKSARTKRIIGKALECKLKLANHQIMRTRMPSLQKYHAGTSMKELSYQRLRGVEITRLKRSSRRAAGYVNSGESKHSGFEAINAGCPVLRAN